MNVINFLPQTGYFGERNRIEESYYIKIFLYGN